MLRPSGSARRCIPPEQVIGTAGGTSYGYDKNGRPALTKQPKLLLNDDNAGKPEGIHLMTGRRPHAAFGNSTGDRQMREYTKAGDGMRLVMLVLHDDRKRRVGFRIQIDGVDSDRGNVAGIPARSHRGNGAHIDDVYTDRTVARPR